MKKEGLLVVLLFVLSINICLATEISVYNDSQVKTEYALGSEVSGLINFSVKNVPANAIIESNLGGNMTLREFLSLNDQALPCESFNCSDVYSASSGSTSRNFNYPSQKSFGFKIAGKQNVQIEGINFSLSSNFQLSNTLPLELDFFEGYNWKFEEPSAQFDRFWSYGCYNFEAPIVGVSQISTTRYCERIDSLPSSLTYKLGANISGSGNTKMIMSLLKGESEIENCDFDASIENECLVQLEDSLEMGEYFVCIAADNTRKEYSFNRESEGITCGYYDSLTDSYNDFPIFVKVPKYSSALNLKLDQDNFDKALDAANAYLDNKYNNGDCSSECVLPITFSGVDQTLQVSSVKIDYRSSNSGEETSQNVYSLANTPFVVNFEGVFDLAKLGFILPSVGDKKLILSIDGAELFEKNIAVLSAPQIFSLEPLNPPAGVPTIFTLNVSSVSNITNYEWNFGDGNIETTTENSVTHTYVNKTIYNLGVLVRNVEGVVASKNFTVISGSPAEIINLSITSKKIKLQNVADSLTEYPTWQADYMKKLLKLDEYMAEVNRLDQKRKTIFTENELIKLALELNDLIIPQSVYVVSEIPVPFIVDAGDIDPTPLRKIGGGIGETDLSGYKLPISQWELENIDGVILIKKFEVLGDNDQATYLMDSYSVNLESKSTDESYLVVNKNIDALETDNTFEFKDVEGYAYLIIPALSSKIFDFVYSSTDEKLNVYVSPTVSKLPYDAPLGVCNFNLVCEKDLEENYKNCRSDCKPVGRTIYWIFLVLLFGLVVYTILQIWYKNYYETLLFEDRAQLFNLVNYIDNMVSRGTFEGVIRMRLSASGWTLERINYAFKKSKGQKAGMYELVPVEKLLSLLRKKESSKNVKANPTLIPATPKMIMSQNTNLNKAQKPKQNIKRW